jgi:NADP-dependent 3-hydroxy acid dehydrogenase YdfG
MTPTQPLSGTVAIVTGASGGIGHATARALAARGAAVALVGDQRDPLEALAVRVQERGGKALVIQADIADEAEARRAVDETTLRLGRVDILVNNPGVMHPGALIGAPIDEWKQMIELNVLGLLYCAHAALPHLLAAADREPRRVADLVNLSPMLGMVAFAASLRQEIGRRHVRICVVEPCPDRVLPFEPDDIADTVTYVVTRPRRVEIDELRIHPAEER